MTLQHRMHFSSRMLANLSIDFFPHSSQKLKGHYFQLLGGVKKIWTIRFPVLAKSIGIVHIFWTDTFREKTELRVFWLVGTPAVNNRIIWILSMKHCFNQYDFRHIVKFWNIFFIVSFLFVHAGCDFFDTQIQFLIFFFIFSRINIVDKQNNSVLLF
jgi:hypothetical protein